MLDGLEPDLGIHARRVLCMGQPVDVLPGLDRHLLEVGAQVCAGLTFCQPVREQLGPCLEVSGLGVGRASLTTKLADWGHRRHTEL
ncbi:MAG TPA: hypothetical protein VGS08_02235 [Candidatus Saccharimonadales bacterium]|nr:hypothetical protein [Candidatus Saccharimonadales bacterium]